MQLKRRTTIYGLTEKAKRKPLKEAGGPNWQMNLNNQSILDELGPEMQKYQVPDFGFDDNLNTHTNDMGIWDLLYDPIRPFPKYERMKNIIGQYEKEK